MNVFERNRKRIYVVFCLGLLCLLFVSAELSLRAFMGLGNPVLYDSNPLYGYRPLPDQELNRFGGALVKFNNLGLRAGRDWNAKTAGKILFLGDSVTYGGSYVDNAELFSAKAVSRLEGFQSGNGAVNAWGIENIYGLLVESAFLPAEIYVTVLIEDDFYRGLTRVLGTPFWCIKPHYALEELLLFVVTSMNNRRYVDWRTMSDLSTKTKVVDKAVSRLHEIDKHLKSRGFSHLIFISPTRDQVLLGAARDEMVATAVQRAGIEVIYLLDRIRTSEVEDELKSSWFHDEVHLEPAGHIAWADFISPELEALTESRQGSALKSRPVAN